MGRAVSALESNWLVDGLRLLEALPCWLRPDGLQSAFEACIPELASGQLSLRKVRPKRLHLDGGARGVALKLVVEDAAGARNEIHVLGVLRPACAADDRAGRAGLGLGDPDWTCPVPDMGLVLETPPPEAALPAHPILTDAERARPLLEAGIRAGSSAYADLGIERCTPKLARFKPGSRCTVVYRLELGPGAEGRGWPDRVVAKSRRGDGSRSAWERMRALWGSPLHSSEAVAIAEPLGLFPDPEVLIQRAVPGESKLLDRLESAMFRDQPSSEESGRLGPVLSTTARGLAEFHASGARVPPYAWRDEMAELRGRAARLSEWVPGLDALLPAALDRLDRLACAAPPQRAVASHGSFRPGQVMLHGDRVAFIDTDGCCRAEPALDVALFRASMKTNIIGSGDGEERAAAAPEWRGAALETLDALGDRFLDEYERLAPICRSRVALWETLYLLENLLNTWEKVRPEQLEGSRLPLERHLGRSRLALD